MYRILHSALDRAVVLVPHLHLAGERCVRRAAPTHIDGRIRSMRAQYGICLFDFTTVPPGTGSSDGPCTIGDVTTWYKRGTVFTESTTPASFDSTYGMTFFCDSYHGSHILPGNINYASNEYESFEVPLSDLLDSDATIEMGVRIWVCHSRFANVFENYNVGAIVELDTGYTNNQRQFWNLAAFRRSLALWGFLSKGQGTLKGATSSGIGDNLTYDPAVNNVTVLEIPAMERWEVRLYYGEMVDGVWPDFSSLSFMNNVAPTAGELWPTSAPFLKMAPPNGNTNLWLVRLGLATDFEGANSTLTTSFSKMKVEVRR